MVANLSFKDGTDSPVNADIKKIVYEDSTGNKYTFGVDNATNVFNTFKYDPNGADPEVDYSATATKFMTGGAVAALLGIGTNVGEIKTKTDFIPDTLTADVAEIKTATNAANLETKLDGIKTKTDSIPDTLTADVAAIKDATNAANLGNKVTAIQTKTDFIPDTLGADVTAIKAKTDTIPVDLNAELSKLATSADVTSIKAKTDKMPVDLGADVTAIKAKTDKMPADLGTDITTIKTQVGTDLISGIKAKTDKMPADLNAELSKLATSADVTSIKAKTDKMPVDLGADVTAIKAKTDKMPADLGTDITTIKTQVGTDLISGIKAKTDKMPADLNAELTKLTTIGNAINGNGNVTAAAKVVLESSFKQAITDAGTDGSNWLEKSVKDIVSQPSFEIPTSDDAALNWTW